VRSRLALADQLCDRRNRRDGFRLPDQNVVTFTIEPFEDIVKLTVTHAAVRDMDELHAIGEGWPAVIANLKTLLETGEVLPQAPWAFHAEARSAQMAKNDR